MKCQIISDIHTEFLVGEREIREYYGEIFSPEADLTIIAGDLSNAGGISDSLKISLDYCNEVIFVPGNHEYYSCGNTGFEYVDSLLDDLACENERLHVMNTASEVIHGIPFVGATGWFPYSNGAVNNRWRCNDFRVIKETVDSMGARNDRDRDFLNDVVGPDSVVITHHLPSSLCVPPYYANSSLNVYFVADFEDVLEKEPRLWVHGHIHEFISFDYGVTRIEARPAGYFGVETFSPPKPFLIDI